MKKPEPQSFGFKNGVWQIKGGENAYLAALKIWQEKQPVFKSIQKSAGGQVNYPIF